MRTSVRSLLVAGASSEGLRIIELPPANAPKIDIFQLDQTNRYFETVVALTH